MTVFNEWHAANTSKKLRAVKKSNALAGIYNGAILAYGYMKANDKKHTPFIDEEVATIVVRIFEMYANSAEQKLLTAEIEEIETKMKDTETTLQSADAFIHNIKKYLEASELTHSFYCVHKFILTPPSSRRRSGGGCGKRG